MFEPREGALMTLKEAERLHKQNWRAPRRNRREAHLDSSSSLNGRQNRLQRAAGRRKLEQSAMFLNDFLGREKERLWKSLVDELGLDGKILYSILSSWDRNNLCAEQVLDAYYERLDGWKTNFSGSEEFLAKECLKRDLLSDRTSSLDKNILSQVIAVSASCDKEEIMSQYQQRMKEVQELNGRLEDQRIRRREAEGKKKEGLLQELLGEMPSLDENVLSQVIAGSNLYDKKVIISEYRKRIARTEEFNRRLIQGEHFHIPTELRVAAHTNAELTNEDKIIAQLTEMGIHEGLVRRVLASGRENLDVNALADICFSLS